jgi:hypothetical protein
VTAVLDESGLALLDEELSQLLDEAGGAMAVSLNKFIVTATTTVPAGTFTADVTTDGPPANFGTGSYAQGAGVYGSGAGSAGGSTTFIKGQLLVLDSGTPSDLYSCLNGLGILRAYVDQSDSVGKAAVSN